MRMKSFFSYPLPQELFKKEHTRRGSRVDRFKELNKDNQLKDR